MSAVDFTTQLLVLDSARTIDFVRFVSRRLVEEESLGTCDVAD